MPRTRSASLRRIALRPEPEGGRQAEDMQSVRRIEDDALRRETFESYKRALIKQAMELSVLCDCDIQLFIYSAKVASGRGGGGVTTQFSSGDAEVLLEHLRKHPAPPAECFDNSNWSPCAEVRELCCLARCALRLRARDKGGRHAPSAKACASGRTAYFPSPVVKAGRAPEW